MAEATVIQDPAAAGTQKLCLEIVRFPNGNEAKLVRAKPDDIIDDLFGVIGISKQRSLILLLGGADRLDDALLPKLRQVFNRGIARAALRIGALIIDGGTDAGVMALMGRAIADNGRQTPLLGVAPAAKVTYPGGPADADSGGSAPLNPNHSQFVLTPGSEWGDETDTLFRLARNLAGTNPVLAILVNGGDTAQAEVLRCVRLKWPVLVVQGSGRLADTIAGLIASPGTRADDADLDEIRCDGRIRVVRLDDDLSLIERVIEGRPAQDPVLVLALRRFHAYDQTAELNQNRYRRSQGVILLLGVLATLLAIYHQHEPAAGDVVGHVLQIAIIVTPIVISILIAGVNRFRPGNKWVLLRAAAESTKREIFRYRTRAGVYNDTQSLDISAEERFTQELERIGTHLIQTEVNVCAIEAEHSVPGAQEMAPLRGPDYVRERLEDQITYFAKQTRKLGLQLQVLQWGVYLLGGVGTLLAAIGLNVWIALTTAIVAAITTKLESDQVETTMIQYNQALTGLFSVRDWWNSLTEWEQDRPANVDLLVDHTEKILESEMAGWVQQMQSALEKLRQQQTEREPESAEKK